MIEFPNLPIFEVDVVYEKKIIAHNLKTTKEQIIGDLNEHIKDLDDDIDNFMKNTEIINFFYCLFQQKGLVYYL